LRGDIFEETDNSCGAVINSLQWYG